MSAAWRIELQLANKEDLAKVGAAKRAETLKQNKPDGDTVLSQNDKTEQPKHNTRSEIAKAANTSAGMVAILTARCAWVRSTPSSLDAALIPPSGRPPWGFCATCAETSSAVAPRARIKPPPGRGKPGRGALPVQRWVPVTGTGD